MSMTSSPWQASPVVASWSQRYLLIAISIWAAGALVIAASGALAALPGLATPVVIWTPVLAAVTAYRRSAGLRGALWSLDLRLIVAYHLVRIAYGVAFMNAVAEGWMPAAFGSVAGPGDVAVGLLALPALWLAGRPNGWKRKALLAWNVLALVDILVAFIAAQRLLVFMADPQMLALIDDLPYSLLPVFVVPAILLSHALLFVRLRRPQGA